MYKVYQVQPTDTLENIARKNNTTLEEIKKINNNLNNIMPGQYIVVPAVEQGIYETYIVKRGDSIYAIAQRYNIDLNDLLAINGLEKNDFIYPNQKIFVPKRNMNIYVTKPNDTLKQVISKLRITSDNLLAQNEKIMLLPDQVLIYSKEGNL